MIRHRQRDSRSVRQDLDRCNARRRVENCDSVCTLEVDGDLFLASNLLPPYDQLERAATFLKKQIMHSRRLIIDVVLKASRIGERSIVSQDCREIVNVSSG